MQEQKQRIQNSPVAAVTQGTISTDVVGQVNMPYVQQAKTSGERLADVFNMGVKTAGIVVQDINEKQAAIQTIEGNARGVLAGTEILKQAEELPIEKRQSFIVNQIRINVESMKGSNVSQAYLKSYLNSSTNMLENYYVKAQTAVLDAAKAEVKLKTSSAVVNMNASGTPHGEILSTIMNANNMNKAEAGKFYVESVGQDITNSARNDPNFDWQTAINKKLKILSEDGVDYAKHPVYGDLINKVEDSLTTLTNTRATAAKEASKQQAVKTTTGILSYLYRDNITPEEIVEAKSVIEANREVFTLEQYKSLHSAVEDAKDVSGYAPISDPVTFANVNKLATNGSLSLPALSLYKNKLTKTEFVTISNSILKAQEEGKDNTLTLLKNGLSDLEVNGRKSVAQVNEFGFALTNVDAEKINMFNTGWNHWLINYQKQHGTYPTYEEAVQKQTSLIKMVKDRYPDELGSTPPAQSPDQAPAPKQVEVKKTSKSVPIDMKNPNSAKQQWLLKATEKEIMQGLQDGSIKPEDLNIGGTSGKKPQGDMTSIIDLVSPANMYAAASYNTMKGFLKAVENPGKANRNPVTGKWSPHASYEGGNNTIGYGHKITDQELKSGKIYGISFRQGLSDKQVETILDKDIKLHQDKASKYIESTYKVKWESLNQKQRDIFSVYTFNGALSKTDKFVKAVLAKDWKSASKYYKVYSKGKELARNKDFKATYLDKELR